MSFLNFDLTSLLPGKKRKQSLKRIIKNAPEVRLIDFFEGFALKVFVKESHDLFSSSYIKEKWAERLYSDTRKIDDSYKEYDKILNNYKARKKEDNLLTNLGVINDSLKTEDDKVNKEKIVRFLYKSSILVEFIDEYGLRNTELSNTSITLMQFLLRHFIACKRENFSNVARIVLNSLEYTPTHCIIFRNNKISAKEVDRQLYLDTLSKEKKSESPNIISNVFFYDVIPEDVIFFNFTALPGLDTPAEEFVLVYINKYPEMYFPIKGVRGKESVNFMNFLPVFQSSREYCFPMIGFNTPVVRRGEEEVILGGKENSKIVPTHHILEDLFTDTFRQKGQIVLEKEYQMETDKINLIASSRAIGLGFSFEELKVNKNRFAEVNHIEVQDKNDIIQREPFIVLEYDYNTCSWWLTEKSSLYNRKVIVEDSLHKKVEPSLAKTFSANDKNYVVYYYELAEDSDYFVNVEYLSRNTILTLKLGSAYDKVFNVTAEPADAVIDDYLKEIFQGEFRQYGTAAGGKLYSGKIKNQECFLKIYDKPMNVNILDQMNAFEEIIIHFIPFKIVDNPNMLTGEEIYLGEENFMDSRKIVTITPPLKIPGLSANKVCIIKDMLYYILNCNAHGYFVFDLLFSREENDQLVGNWLYTGDDRIVIPDLGAYYKNNRSEFKRYYQAYKRRHKIPNDTIKPMTWQMYLVGVLCYQVWNETVEIPNSGLPKKSSPLVIKNNEKLQKVLQKFIDLEYTQLETKLIDEIVKAFEEGRKDNIMHKEVKVKGSH